jgi:hypothetical protein
MMALLAPFALGDPELQEHRIRLQVRIGNHLQKRRAALLHQIFDRYREYLAADQPMLPEPTTFDWEGSMYADLALSEHCQGVAARHGVSPTVGLYLETGVGGVPLDGFCTNRNLVRHGLAVNGDDPDLRAFLDHASRHVRLSFGMTPPPR